MYASRTAVAAWAIAAALVVAGCQSKGPTQPEPGCRESCPPPPALEGTWSSAAEMPTARREMPAALLDGRIYVAGGIGAGQEVLSILERYDPSSGSWSPAPAMPEPRHHHGAASLNGRLYVVGGYSTLGANWTMHGSLMEFDPAAQTWAFREPLPEPLAAMGAAAADGKLFVFGGARNGHEVNGTYVYDPQTNAWSARAPMPTAREHVGAVAIGSTIYVAGGRTFSGTNLDVLEAYSPATDSWRTLAPMGVARSGHGIAALSGKLYVFGGENLQIGGVLDGVEEYDPQANAWRRVKPLLSGLTGPGVVGLSSAIHVLGGGGSQTFASAAHSTFRVP